MIILGIDPGKTTGIVVTKLTEDKPLKVEYSEEIKGFYPQITFFDKIVPRVDLILCENFIPRATAYVADAPSACEPIGVIKYLSNHHDISLQLPVPQARKAVSNNVMKKAGYWIRGQEHSRQALKHVLAYVVRELEHAGTITKLHPR